MISIQTSENEFLCANVDYGDMVWVKSRQFDCECWAYVQGMSVIGLSVRVELNDDHPSMIEATREYPDAEHIELIDHISFEDVEFVRHLTRPDKSVFVWKREITDQERAARARGRGFKRLALPELDSGLGTQRRRSE